MGRHPYKKRNQAVAVSRPSTVGVQRFPPTKYETPLMTLKNFPSSIMNGVTREGGLYSLTLKSINCAKYVENNDNMRRVFKKRKLEVPKISHLNRSEILEKLLKDVEKERGMKLDLQTAEDDRITTLNTQWDTLLKSDADLSDINNKVLQEIESGGKRFRFVDDKYSLAKDVVTDVYVDRIEDVKDLDLTEYEQTVPAANTESIVAEEVNEILPKDKVLNENAKVLDQLHAYQDEPIADTGSNQI
ncbi:hypothetical protein KGF57_000468 [Candida theae]|uniref:Uncharacterized protein n=1 Tax=Candida theae TaxID=1198502 RepID=A0AAD5BIN6_9ASCO|nr:uncharacterized protein KGF57_000468 [Candida theae]KAI5967040.1 hypothetical protein KGF57_000468 [Candida theae]